MSVAIVQSASYNDGSGSSTTPSITLASTPTVGNLLLWFGGFDFNKTYHGNPTGWNAVSGTNPHTSVRAAMSALSRVVQSGDGKTWSFQQINTADTETAILIEISGQATSGFINQSGYANSTTLTTNVSASVTPSVLNCLALAFITTDFGAAGTQATDAATFTSGWSADQRPYSDFHSSWLIHKTALTSDTTTAITETASNLSSGNNTSLILLIAPATAAAVTAAPTHMMMGMGA